MEMHVRKTIYGAGLLVLYCCFTPALYSVFGDRSSPYGVIYGGLFTAATYSVPIALIIGIVNYIKRSHSFGSYLAVYLLIFPGIVGIISFLSFISAEPLHLNYILSSLLLLGIIPALIVSLQSYRYDLGSDEY